MILTDWIAYWADITPNKIACQDCASTDTHSYKTINTKAEQLALHFQNTFHLKKGDRICIISENCIEYIYLFAIAQKMGLILVPLNYRLQKAEVAGLISNAEPSLIIFQDIFKTLLSPQHQDIVALEITGLLSLPLNSTQKIQLPDISEDDTLFILYTSGSTGIPKGVLYTHGMLLWNSINTSISLEISSNTITLNVMPLFHTGGWNVLLTPVIHHGGTVLLMNKFTPSDVIRNLAFHQCNQFMAVPTMLKAIAEDPLFKESQFNLNYIIVGGEAMPLKLIHLYNEKGLAIRQGFGMTEAGPNLTSLHDEYVLNKIGSIGKPNMYINVKVIDEKGIPVKPGNRGELCFSGRCVTPGYWNNEIASKKTIQDGWLHSGDIAIQDEDGFLFIVDRIKNMYISGGENVYPAEVEKVLITNIDIDEVVIIGVEDKKWGEVGKAFLVLKNPISNEAIISYCSEHLSKFKIPKHFVRLDTIPKLSNGKIDRKKCRNL